MNVIEMPDDNKDRGDKRFGAVRHLGCGDDAARQELCELRGKPDDKSANAHYG